MFGFPLKCASQHILSPAYCENSSHKIGIYEIVMHIFLLSNLKKNEFESKLYHRFVMCLSFLIRIIKVLY